MSPLPDHLTPISKPDPDIVAESFYDVSLYDVDVYMSEGHCGSFADELYARLEPYAVYDEQLGWALKYLVCTIGQMFQEVEDLARDNADGDPGWSQVVDLNRAVNKALVWLTQFIGVPFTPMLKDETDEAYADRLRALIVEREGWERGSPAALRRAAERWLTGTQQVWLTERWGNRAYRLAIRTMLDETPNPALTLAEILKTKPAGVVLDYDASDGITYGLIAGAHVDYAELLSEHPTYADVLVTPPDPD